MRERRILLQQLLNKDRIDFVTKNYFRQLKFILSLFIVVISIFIAAIFLFMGITFTTLLVGFTISGLALIAVNYFRKRVKSTSIMGDTLILNSMNRTSCVTSIRSIRKVKTKSMLGIQWTNLVFKLDGTTRSASFFTNAAKIPVSPEISLQKAIKLSKKQKANHKPDSVSVR